MTKSDLQDREIFSVPLLSLSRAGTPAVLKARAFSKFLPDRILLKLLPGLMKAFDQIAVLDEVLAHRHRSGKQALQPQDPGNTAATLSAMIEGDFTACASVTERPRASQSRNINLAVRSAGQLWSAQVNETVPSINEKKLLVLLGDGADWRALNPFLQEHHHGRICLLNAKSLQQKPAPPPKRFELTINPVNKADFQDDIFARTRHFCNAYMTQLVTFLEESTQPIPINAFETCVGNQLNLDIGTSLQKCREAIEVAHATQPEGIIIIEGNGSADFLADALLAEHLECPIYRMSGSPKLADRLEFSLRRGKVSFKDVYGSAKSAKPAQADLALYETIGHFAKKVNIKGLAGKIVLAADFRNKEEFRYLPTAFLVLDQLARSHKVAVLQQRNLASRRLLALKKEIKRRNPKNISVSTARSPHAFPLQASAPDWTGKTGQIASRVFDELSIFPDSWRSAIMTTTHQFLTAKLPGFLALGLKAQDSFALAPPGAIAFFPGSQPFNMVMASAARAAGVPTIDIQTLLIGRSSRDCLPICENIAIIDTDQRRIFMDRFGIKEKNTVLIGHIDMATSKKHLEQAQQEKSGDALPEKKYRRRILFASQPMGDAAIEAFHNIVEAISQRPDTEMILFCHPGEPEDNINHYKHTFANTENPDKFIFGGKGTPISQIVQADIVVNIISNVGFKAAALGKDVIMIDPFDGAMAVRLDKMGLALRATNASETLQCLDQLLDRQPEYEKLQKTRQKYLEQNPAMAKGNTVEMITQALINLANQKSLTGE